MEYHTYYSPELIPKNVMVHESVSFPNRNTTSNRGMRPSSARPHGASEILDNEPSRRMAVIESLLRKNTERVPRVRPSSAASHRPKDEMERHCYRMRPQSALGRSRVQSPSDDDAQEDDTTANPLTLLGVSRKFWNEDRQSFMLKSKLLRPHSAMASSRVDQVLPQMTVYCV